MLQYEYLKILCLANPDAVIIGSIGTISYDLAKIDKEISHPKKILIRGAMGATLGCGLGYAMAKPDKHIIVVIGEGSLLMQMGSIATILKHNLSNLDIVIIANYQYSSCGGQSNDFASIEHMLDPHFEIFVPKLSPTS